MEPELQNPVEEPSSTGSGPASAPEFQPTDGRPGAAEHRGFEWAVIGPQGLRAGWSILLFAAVFYLFREIVGTIFFASGLIGDTNAYSAANVLLGGLVSLLALLGALAFMALIEDRRIFSYNLAGPHRIRHLVSGVALGFVALSLLVASLAWGGWLQFGAAAISPPQAFRMAALWGCAFLVVASVEEGLFRCYALFTLTRGISFWWALAVQIATCVYLIRSGNTHGAWGVYLAAALGFFPCFILHLRSAVGNPFWQAAWVTSTVFALYHTSNSGENWIGIFAAAFIGFVFCVSVRLTGSAWWAIGCHAVWDWAETFFYGTADSGIQGQGHFLTANPTGNLLWSGGADGPEGSLLVFGVILLLLLLVLGLYGRAGPRASGAPATPRAAD